MTLTAAASYTPMLAIRRLVVFPRICAPNVTLERIKRM
jgi:hypothetical protein